MSGNGEPDWQSSSDEDDLLMTEDHKKLIRAKTDILIESLDLNSTLLARLRSRNVLQSGDVSRINEGNGDSERVQVFLNIFLKKPDSAYRELVLALRDRSINQRHVAKVLDRNKEIRTGQNQPAPGTPQIRPSGQGSAAQRTVRPHPLPVNQTPRDVSSSTVSPSRSRPRNADLEDDPRHSKDTHSTRKSSGHASRIDEEGSPVPGGSGTSGTPQQGEHYTPTGRIPHTVRVRAALDANEDDSTDEEINADVNFPDLTPTTRRHRARTRTAELNETIMTEIKEACLLEVRNLKRVAKQGVNNKTMKERDVLLRSLKELQEMQREMIDVVDGSVVFVLKCPTLVALDNLKMICYNGMLNRLLQEDFVTDRIKREFHVRSVNFSVTLMRGDYQRCRRELHKSEAVTELVVKSCVPTCTSSPIDSPKILEDCCISSQYEESVKPWVTGGKRRKSDSPDSVASSGIFSCSTVSHISSDRSNNNSSNTDEDLGIGPDSFEVFVN